MDLDKELVHAVLAGGEEVYRKVVDRGIEPDKHLAGIGRIAWEYVTSYRKEYGSIPSREAVFAKLNGVDLSATGKDSIDFILNSLIERRLFNTLREGTDRVRGSLEKIDPAAAADTWREIHRKITEENLTAAKIESLLALGGEVLKQYQDAKSGVRGIATPWPTMTEQTMGWFPEDLALFAGRLGVGKTWLMIILLHAAWKDNKKILVISTEMSKVRLAQRFFALHLQMPYEGVRKGRLGEFVEKKFADGVGSMLSDQGLYIVGGGFDFSIDSVDQAIADCAPDLAGIDGSYLIKNVGKDRHEKVSNTFDDFKRITKRRKIAILTNTQLNRQAKTNKEETVSAENLSQTDVAGWNSDAIYGISQTDDMRVANRMSIKPLKVREGKADKILIKWDLESMDFSEIKDGNSVSPNMPPSATPSSSGDSDDNDGLPF